ncbi:alpha/beta fold hydrolase [Streptomyces sp. NPDC008121]|uniref:alpha/beta hydrolase n=1 Tax=Streptomyces sp. NPDC008121 TaxID=3364809 RepID=UPI0036E335FB
MASVRAVGWWRIGLPLLALALAAPLLAVPARAGGDAGGSGDGSGIGWGKCGGGAANVPGMQCAQVEVPLDWTLQNGRNVTVGLTRLPARRPGARLGSLVFNPGGPGAAASAWLAFEAGEGGVFSKGVRDRYDIIGFDPRGVGMSTPAVRCDPGLWNKPVSLFPSSPAAYARLEAKYAAFGESCLRMTGPLLAHLDTVSVARDLEVVRERLGEGKLSFLGLSYGSEIGEEYARLFPRHVSRLALDGALVHSLPAVVLHENESVAYERSLERFAQWCRKAAECALRGRDPLAVFSNLVARADKAPLPAPDCRSSGGCRAEVTGEDIRLRAQEYLLARDGLPVLSLPGWKDLGQALAKAEKGDASGLSVRVIKTADDPEFSGLAVGCADFRSSVRGYAALKTQMAMAKVVAPRTQGASQSYGYITRCMRWPTAFVNPHRSAAVATPGATPLIINSLYDPSTAYVWAQQMLTEMKGSVLLTREGDGHTSYLLPGQARDAIDRYLVSGQTPPPGTFVRS